MTSYRESCIATEMEREAFVSKIVKTINEHPEWSEDALKAITHGTQLAIKDLTHRNSEMNIALLSALSLVDKKRLSKSIIENYNRLICRGLGDPEMIAKHGSPLEQAMMELYGGNKVRPSTSQAWIPGENESSTKEKQHDQEA